MDAYRYGARPQALVPLGWAGIVAGGLALGGGKMLEVPVLSTIGTVMVGVGVLLAVAFAGVGQKPLKRLATGLLQLTRFTTAFGDVLSYLRLFALGLASGSLAGAFNGMAKGIHEGLPGIGFLFAILVLILGHTMNVFLSAASGVIHGLRLNVIEFFNWSLKEEGKQFQPFKRKEQSEWNP
jgi:V/A-type H+-transporting ATPase subunit I